MEVIVIVNGEETAGFTFVGTEVIAVVTERKMDTISILVLSTES